MKKKIIDILVPIICLIAGIMFFIFGVKEFKARQNYIKTDGEIVSIDYEYIDEDHTNYYVLVEYIADGEELTSELGEYDASMEVGKAIKIMYNPNNHSEIVTASYFAVVMDFVISIIGFVALALSIVSQKKKKNNSGSDGDDVDDNNINYNSNNGDVSIADRISYYKKLQNK